MKEFVAAYIACALWCGVTDRHGNPVTNARKSQLLPSARETLRKDAEEFFRNHAGLVSGNPDRAGQDFWLTRNRHGAGFWDGAWPQAAAQELTKAAHAYGEQSLYTTDRGKIDIF